MPTSKISSLLLPVVVKYHLLRVLHQKVYQRRRTIPGSYAIAQCSCEPAPVARRVFSKSGRGGKGAGSLAGGC